MHPETLAPTQRAVLDGLSSIATVQEFYLAGGTALALRHGHRRSIDFDFFSPTTFDAQELAVTLESAFAAFERLPTGAHTLYVR